MNNKRDTLNKIAKVAVVVALTPSSWTRPVLNSVVLPAHAQMSPEICSNSVNIRIFNTVGLDVEQFGIDGATCAQNADPAVTISVDEMSRAAGSTVITYDVVVVDATGVAGSFTLIADVLGLTDIVSVQVEFLDTAGRSWAGPIRIDVNFEELSVNGVMNLIP